ncbi:MULTISPECIES: response regulator transcription factor [Nocardioides]|uniref:response regulator transcription factor n=1 Tax=Nocardioides TaxID=1839 RepID=UPI000416EABA|nr:MULTISPECIES: response regulator transcription factor [Nocardioides]
MNKRPVRVTLARESELVTRGFNALMAPYADRVAVLPAHGGTPAEGVDLTLFDSLADIQVLPGVLGDPVPHDGRLVTWTWNARPDLTEMALGSGACGVLSKALPGEVLVRALEAIHHGRVVVDLGEGHTSPRRQRPDPLTPREADVIAMITSGLDNQSIADTACISINSVKSYIRSAYRKMGVTSRSQAVLWGVRHGYLGPARMRDDSGTLSA